MVQRRTRIVFLGDSVTAGYGLASAAASSFVSRLTASDPTAELITSALEGIDTAYALKRFHRLVTAHDPEWVVILLGLNDAVPSGQRAPIAPPSYESHLLSLVDRVVALSARPVLVTPNPRFVARPSPGAEASGWCAGRDLMAPYAAALVNAAKRSGYPWIDVRSRFLAASNLAELLPDGVHPGAAGHELIATILAAELPCFWGRPAAATPAAQTSAQAVLDRSF